MFCPWARLHFEYMKHTSRRNTNLDPWTLTYLSKWATLRRDEYTEVAFLCFNVSSCLGFCEILLRHPEMYITSTFLSTLELHFLNKNLNNHLRECATLSTLGDRGPKKYILPWALG
jgi:hypothetical protein